MYAPPSRCCAQVPVHSLPCSHGVLLLADLKDSEGTLKTSEVTATFVNGKPRIVKAHLDTLDLHVFPSLAPLPSSSALRRTGALCRGCWSCAAPKSGTASCALWCAQLHRPPLRYLIQSSPSPKHSPPVKVFSGRPTLYPVATRNVTPSPMGWGSPKHSGNA